MRKETKFKKKILYISDHQLILFLKETTTTPRPVTKPPQQKLPPCRGFCLISIMAGFCKRPNTILTKTSTCPSGSICCEESNAPAVRNEKKIIAIFSRIFTDYFLRNRQMFFMLRHLDQGRGPCQRDRRRRQFRRHQIHVQNVQALASFLTCHSLVSVSNKKNHDFYRIIRIYTHEIGHEILSGNAELTSLFKCKSAGHQCCAPKSLIREISNANSSDSVLSNRNDTYSSIVSRPYTTTPLSAIVCKFCRCPEHPVTTSHVALRIFSITILCL